MRIIRFHPGGMGTKPCEPRKEVLGVVVPLLITRLVAKLRAVTNSWKKKGYVEVDDYTHQALKNFRDEVHELVTKSGNGHPAATPDKKPKPAEAIVWILALNGHVVEYGKASEPPGLWGDR